MTAVIKGDVMVAGAGPQRLAGTPCAEGCGEQHAHGGSSQCSQGAGKGLLVRGRMARSLSEVEDVLGHRRYLWGSKEI